MVCVSLCRFLLLATSLHAVAWGQEHKLILPALKQPATEQAANTPQKRTEPAAATRSAKPAPGSAVVSEEALSSHEACLSAEMRQVSLTQLHASPLERLTLERLQAWGSDEVLFWCHTDQDWPINNQKK